MEQNASCCPMKFGEIVQRYFIENRSRLLDIAAFLDRLDRAKEKDSGDDFRIDAFVQALEEALKPGPGRVERVHAILSDQSIEPIDSARKSQGAFGAPRASCC